MSLAQNLTNIPNLVKTIIWADEFTTDNVESPTIDTSNWHLETGPAQTNHELETFTTESLILANNSLYITADLLNGGMTGNGTDPGDGGGPGSGSDTLDPLSDISSSNSSNNNFLLTSIKAATTTPTPPSSGAGGFTSGRIHSLKTFQPNWQAGEGIRIEASIRAPRGGKGIWPAFWLQSASSTSYGSWPSNGEIDIWESVNTNMHTGYSTIHYGQGINAHHYDVLSTTSTTKGFHVWSVDWYIDRMIFSLDHLPYHVCFPAAIPSDGESITSTKGQTIPDTSGWWAVVPPGLAANASTTPTTIGAPFDRPFQIVLDLAVGGSWPGAPSSNLSYFPQNLRIDYVRVSSLDDTNSLAAASFTNILCEVNLGLAGCLNVSAFQNQTVIFIFLYLAAFLIFLAYPIRYFFEERRNRRREGSGGEVEKKGKKEEVVGEEGMGMESRTLTPNNALAGPSGPDTITVAALPPIQVLSVSEATLPTTTVEKKMRKPMTDLLHLSLLSITFTTSKLLQLICLCLSTIFLTTSVEPLFMATQALDVISWISFGCLVWSFGALVIKKLSVDGLQVLVDTITIPNFFGGEKRQGLKIYGRRFINVILTTFLGSVVSAIYVCFILSGVGSNNITTFYYWRRATTYLLAAIFGVVMPFVFWSFGGRIIKASLKDGRRRVEASQEGRGTSSSSSSIIRNGVIVPVTTPKEGWLIQKLSLLRSHIFHQRYTIILISYMTIFALMTFLIIPGILIGGTILQERNRSDFRVLLPLLSVYETILFLLGVSGPLLLLMLKSIFFRKGIFDVLKIRASSSHNTSGEEGGGVILRPLSPSALLLAHHHNRRSYNPRLSTQRYSQVVLPEGYRPPFVQADEEDIIPSRAGAGDLRNHHSMDLSVKSDMTFEQPFTEGGGEMVDDGDSFIYGVEFPAGDGGGGQSSRNNGGVEFLEEVEGGGEGGYNSSGNNSHHFNTSI